MHNHFRLTSIGLVTTLMVAIVVVVATGTHVVGVRAQAYSSGPHGFYDDDTGYCLLCHDIHGAAGENLLSASIESEVCFTCHNGTGSIYNTRAQLDLDPTTNAMHPIVVDLPHNAGIYQTVPNTTAGIAPPGPYMCSQCHNPHGETGFPGYLRAQYMVDEYVAYPGDPAGPDPYALCWTCHNTSMIVEDEVFFTKHKDHIQSKSAPCTACHYSSHGVPFSKLVNFNPAFVGPSAPNPNPIYNDQGPNHGSCTLTCHGKDHMNLAY